MSEFRIEHDFLGDKEVPKDAYYGVQSLRAMENFPITGYRIDDALIDALAVVKKAAARANWETGHMEERIAKAIMEAADEIASGKLHDQFLVDPIQGGAGTSINMNGNEVIANRALEILGEEKGNYKVVSPNSHVNMAQSTNDAFPTAVHLAILTRLEGLLEAMGELKAAFEAKSEEFDGVIKMGRTHLQDAVPIRLGQEFGAHACALGRDIERIGRTREHLYEVNMGATTVWERWNSILPDGSISGTGMNSLNHYAYGSIVDWMYRNLCGLNPVEEAPGFKKAVIRPMPDARLSWAKMKLDSAAGTYQVAWKYVDGQLHGSVTVPFDCQAQLLLPDGTQRQLTAGTYVF